MGDAAIRRLVLATLVRDPGGAGQKLHFFPKTASGTIVNLRLHMRPDACSGIGVDAITGANYLNQISQFEVGQMAIMKRMSSFGLLLVGSAVLLVAQGDDEQQKDAA